MRVQRPGDERPVAWSAIVENTPVYAAHGEHVGDVDEVLGAEDIFHGIVVQGGLLSDKVMVPADRITSITNRQIDTGLSVEEFKQLPPYREEESFQLGFVGLIRKHLGWVPEGEHDKRGEDTD